MKITFERMAHLIECETKLNLVTEFRKKTLKLLGKVAYPDAIDTILGLDEFVDLVKKEAEANNPG